MSHYPHFQFNILQKSAFSKAKLGQIHTPHGVIDTPNFIFCATKATLKGVMPRDIKQTGTQFILSNTYHLMIQPGADYIEKLGGLHQFMGWDGPMLTDSGGFQIFSLGHGSVADEIKGRGRPKKNKSLLKITEEGATFRAHTSGKKYLLTPEISIDVQRKLGADIILVLDECTPFHSDRHYTKKSMEMSHRWAIRSLKDFDRLNHHTQALYGIVQGGVFQDLRKISADFVNSHAFFGQAVGGTLGADKNQMYDVVHYAMDHLNQQKPTHLLGIGGLSDIIQGVKMGVDTFDCVHPTRIARHGHAYFLHEEKEHINLNNSRFKDDADPIDPSCACYTCQNFSRAYLHHLIKAKELLIFSLLTIHNLYFMNEFMAHIRHSIHQNDPKF